jgi:hypothetical protein
MTDSMKSATANNKNLFARLSPCLRVSIDQCSSDLEMYSLALVCRAELENAKIPPIKKARPVSSNSVFEKYAINKPEFQLDTTKIANTEQFTIQIRTFSFIVHFKIDGQSDCAMQLTY